MTDVVFVAKLTPEGLRRVTATFCELAVHSSCLVTAVLAENESWITIRPVNRAAAAELRRSLNEGVLHALGWHELFIESIR